MNDNLNNKFFEELMSHIMEGVNIPKVQIERAVGPIIGMFIEPVISAIFEDDANLSGDYITLCPEFPLRKSSNQNDPNHSTNIDWLMYNKTRNEIVFLELKTTDTTFKNEQLQTYLELQRKIEIGGAIFLIDDIKEILKYSKESGKYKNILDKLNTILPNFEKLFAKCKTAKVYYLAPEVLRESIETGLGHDNRFFSFKDLPTDIKSLFNIQWKLLLEQLITLDSDTRNIRNGEAESTKGLNYKYKVNYENIISQCEANGDLIEVGFDGGMKALKSCNLSTLKDRKEYKYDSSEVGTGKKD